MSDFQTVTASLLSNFATIRFTCMERSWGILGDTYPDGIPFPRLLQIADAEKLQINSRRLALRVALNEQCHYDFLDKPEWVDVDGERGWRLHMFFIEQEPIGLLPGLTDGTVTPGDPMNLDPKKFVERRLRQLRGIHRASTHYEWHDEAIDNQWELYAQKVWGSSAPFR